MERSAPCLATCHQVWVRPVPADALPCVVAYFSASRKSARICAAGGNAGWPGQEGATYEELLELEDVKVTAPAAALRQLEHSVYSAAAASRVKETACLVCQEDWVDGDQLTTLPCGHVFHSACVTKWLKDYSNKCPVCKEAIR